MEEKYQKIITELGADRIKRNEPLSLHTTYKIGGPADLYFEANSEDELVRVVKIAKEAQISYLILGGGSNLLIGDGGFRGIVIKDQRSNIKYPSFALPNEQASAGRQKSKIIVYAEAGVMMGTLLNEAVDNSFSGLEFMAGIPGSVGGSVAGNAGAWQKSLSDIIFRVKVLAPEGEIKWYSKEECGFDYRYSRFKAGNEIILAAELELKEGDSQEIKRQIVEILEKRASQPKEPSAGCVFVNPKPTSAGALIEQCGLKGKIIGGAQISEKHANFIINLGGAKAADVVSLIDLAKSEVKNKFNIDLTEEILRIGEFI